MIGSLSGVVFTKNPPQVVVECNGVGYEVDVPMSTFYDLPNVGGTVRLLTHLAIREDAHVLYGFLTAGERTAFRQLIKINGIGARTALSILSSLSVGDLAAAINTQDAGRLVKVPGIGKKTAERLLLELKGKMEGVGPASSDAAPADGRADILAALSALGYSEKEGVLALKQVQAGVSVSEGIKQALKALSRP